MRTWFYRVFLVMSVLFMALFNLIALLVDQTNGLFWLMKTLPSNIAYINLLLLNTGQAVIAVFLSSEFLKSDKKLDTSEVFYVHPLSNAEYVIGKLWGILSVFFRLDLMIIIMLVLFNLASGIEVDWLSYISLFFLICIPTLVYILGLSVMLMLIFKNQAVTFVLLLGYIGLTLFYVGDKYYYLFDYMAYNIPLVKSSIVGFTNRETFINHRFIYLFLGLGFICVSIFLFRRLPNNRYGRYGWLAVGCCFFIVAGSTAYRHVNSVLDESRLRSVYTEVNNKYVNTPILFVDRYDIFVEQKPETIVAETFMQGVAAERASVFTFCLNPGLKVVEIKSGGTPLSFEREGQIILVDFGREFAESDSVSLSVKYEGRIEERFCYLDMPSDVLRQRYEFEMFGIDKKYAFQEHDYLLFTPEVCWYPRPGTSYSSITPDWQRFYFSRFRLTVKTLEGLEAISQGTRKRAFLEPSCTIPADTLVGISEQNRDGLFIFESDFPTPAISLIVGDYEQKSIQVDSTEFSIRYLRGHDFFSSAFDSIADTIPAQIREYRRSLESHYSLDYSFKRFSLVEVPVQFYSYARTWTQAQEKIQPEMILFPEKGCLFNEANIVGRVENEKKWAKWNGQDITEKEALLRSMNAFMNLFRRTESNIQWSMERGAENVSVQANPYLIFPQLYNFRYNIFSSEWSVANRMIELFLQGSIENSDWIRQTNGISNNEKANLLMQRTPFKELLSDRKQRNLLDNILSLKADCLFAPAECKIGYREFRDSLRAVLKRNKFRNLRFEQLLDTLGAITGEDLRTPVEAWRYPTPLPVYIIGLPEVIRVSNRDKNVYIFKLRVTNDSDYDGIIHMEINFGGQHNSYDPRTQRKISFAPHQTKQLVSVWDEAPRNINVNTLISANLPGQINLPINNIVRERNRTIDEEGDFIIDNLSYDMTDEVIVDNEDSVLFVLSEPEVFGLLPRWLDRVDNHSFRYSGVSEWRPPLQWTLTTRDKYYGTYIRSAYVIKSGTGNQTATWKIPVPRAGQYDVYYYVYKSDELRNENNGARNKRNDMKYHFKICYDRDEEEAYMDMMSSDEGWNLLGNYYFNEDTVRVVLTNETKLRTVTADAVKIVRKGANE